MEKTVEVTDEDGGVGLVMVQYKDVLVPKDLVDQYPNGSIAEQLKQIKEMRVSEGDVLLCSYPKTGSHWTFNLVSLLLYDGPVDQSPSFAPTSVVIRPVESISAMPGPKVVHSHFMYDRMPSGISSRSKVILVVRNPKDTAVSLFVFLQKVKDYQIKQSWDHFVSTFLSGPVPFGPYSAFLKSFEATIKENKDTNIHVVYYEDLIRTGLEEMRRLQSYLGCNHSDETLQAILDRCSLWRLRDDVKEGRTKQNIKGINGEYVIYRKGEVGDWRNYFTVAQSEAFDVEWEAQMKDSVFNFRYT